VLQIIVWLTILFAIILITDQVDLVETTPPMWAFAILGLIAFAFFWGYYIFFEVVWNGQSIGKRIVGLRVVRTNGTPITFTESVIRNLIRLIDFLPAYYGIGVVTMFINAQSRRLGDLAAGTLVVYDRPTVTLESLKAQPSWHRLLQSQAYSSEVELPIERLTNQDIQMAEEFLNRQHEFSGSTTNSLVAERIADALLKRMEIDISQASVRSKRDLILKVIQAYRNQTD
jgi:uncharacterized RDD family membrane protein YckC